MKPKILYSYLIAVSCLDMLTTLIGQGLGLFEINPVGYWGLYFMNFLLILLITLIYLFYEDSFKFRFVKIVISWSITIKFIIVFLNLIVIFIKLFLI